MAVFDGESYIDHASSPAFEAPCYVCFWAKVSAYSDEAFRFIFSQDNFNTGNSRHIFEANDGSGNRFARVSGNSHGPSAGAAEDVWAFVEFGCDASGNSFVAVDGDDQTSFIGTDPYTPTTFRVGWTPNEAFEPFLGKATDLFVADDLPDSGDRAAMQAGGDQETILGASVVFFDRMRDSTVGTNTGVTFDSDFPYELGGGDVDVAPDLVASTATVYSATVDIHTDVVPGLVSNTATVHDPVVDIHVDVLPDAVTGAVVVHEPSIVYGLDIVPDVVASTATVHSPSVELDAGDQTIEPDLVESVATVYEASILFELAVVPDTVASSAAVHDPTLTYELTITPDLVSSAAVVHNPRVRDPDVVRVAGGSLMPLLLGS